MTANRYTVISLLSPRGAYFFPSIIEGGMTYTETAAIYYHLPFSIKHLLSIIFYLALIIYYLPFT